jgi:alpha-L-fucosidase
MEKYLPEIIYFDWAIAQPAFQQYLQIFAAYYYNRMLHLGRGAVINYKGSTFPNGAAVLDLERRSLNAVRPLYWQTDTSVSWNSWGYIFHHIYKTPTEFIAELVDIVNKNVGLLLNIGPRADGTILEQEQGILLAVGD